MVKKTKKDSVKCGIHHAFEITQVKMVWISHTCSSLFPSRPAKATSSFWVQFPNFNNPEKQGFLTKNNVVKQIKQTEKQLIANQDTLKKNSVLVIGPFCIHH